MLRSVWLGLIATNLALLPASLAAKEDYSLPTYTPAYEPRTVDERGMWMEADEYERRLKLSPLLVNDKALNSYVERVLCQTVGQDRCSSVRIYVMEVPAFNATMHPNGILTVWTGLLLRVRSEAELGAILGHEFGHFELRHSLMGFKNRRSTSDALAWVQVLGGLSNTDTSYNEVSLIGSIYRFNREQEEDADLLGLKYLAGSSYPSSAASKVWQHLMEESDATAAGRKLKSKNRYSSGFFDTHPSNLKRALYLTEEAAEYGDSGDEAIEGHFKAIAPHLPRLLAAQTKLNDFGGSEYILQELAAVNGWNPSLLYARGEMYQLRGNPRDNITASQLYGEALSAGYEGPEVYKNLGLTLLKSGKASEAKPKLQEYLERLPDASDADVIRMLIAQ